MQTVCLDSGHGGFDKGAIALDGGRECDFNWQLTKAAGDHLVERYKVNVVYTHEGDTSVLDYNDLDAELSARAKAANDAQASLFVSIHHNAASNSKARGGSLYLWTPKRDNSGGLVWLPAVGNHKAPRSYKLAQEIYPKIAGALAEFGVPWQGQLMCADFQVLHDCTGPCMLLEAFFGSNKDDVAAARKPEFIPAIAKAIADGIADALLLVPQTITPPPGMVLVKVDDAYVDCNAKLEDGSTVGKLRTLAEAMGGRVTWDQEHRTMLVNTGHLPGWQR